jgi:hypothetical protein
LLGQAQSIGNPSTPPIGPTSGGGGTLGIGWLGLLAWLAMLASLASRRRITARS